MVRSGRAPVDSRTIEPPIQFDCVWTEAGRVRSGMWREIRVKQLENAQLRAQDKRNKPAALKLMRKLLKRYAYVPDLLITNDLRSSGAAVHEHQPTRRRESKTQGFKRRGIAQRFPSTHAALHNFLNVQRHLTSAQRSCPAGWCNCSSVTTTSG